MPDNKSTKVAPLSTDSRTDAELAKGRGQTESQKEVKAYHAGKFQTHDPVTGEKREDGDKVLASRKDK